MVEIASDKRYTQIFLLIFLICLLITKVSLRHFQIFKTVTSKEHVSDKVRNLLEDPQLDPSVQEKIKISFAEGYMAGQEIPPKAGVLPSYLFRVLKSFTIIILVMVVMLVTLRFIPVYFTSKPTF